MHADQVRDIYAAELRGIHEGGLYKEERVIITPQQAAIRDAIRAAGGRCDHHVIQSPDGHDGFLLAARQVGSLLAGFLREVDV